MVDEQINERETASILIKATFFYFFFHTYNDHDDKLFDLFTVFNVTSHTYTVSFLSFFEFGMVDCGTSLFSLSCVFMHRILSLGHAEKYPSSGSTVAARTTGTCTGSTVAARTTGTCKKYTESPNVRGPEDASRSIDVNHVATRVSFCLMQLTKKSLQEIDVIFKSLIVIVLRTVMMCPLVRDEGKAPFAFEHKKLSSFGHDEVDYIPGRFALNDPVVYNLM